MVAIWQTIYLPQAHNIVALEQLNHR